MDDVDRFQARLLARESESMRELCDAVRRCADRLAEWIDANSYLTDHRRYNRARRKAVRAILDGISHEH